VIIVDTSIISSLAKINRLKMLKSIFENETILIVYEVVNELLVSKKKGYDFVDRILEVMAYKKSDLKKEKWLLKKYPDEKTSKLIDQLNEKYPHIHSCEIVSIAFAKQYNAILLIDDRRAMQVAKKEKIETYTLPSLIQYCKEVEIIRLSEVKEIIKLLELKDHYKFQKDVKKELSKE
jgi:predicted nucleic acid-binding protein